MINNKQQIMQLILANKQAFRDLGVKRVGLFGSFARGEQSDKSDIDLLIDFLPGQKSYQNFLRLVDLGEKLSGRAVEILTPQSISPYLAPYIEKEVEYVQTA